MTLIPSLVSSVMECIRHSSFDALRHFLLNLLRQDRLLASALCVSLVGGLAGVLSRGMNLTQILETVSLFNDQAKTHRVWKGIFQSLRCFLLDLAGDLRRSCGVRLVSARHSCEDRRNCSSSKYDLSWSLGLEGSNRLQVHRVIEKKYCALGIKGWTYTRYLLDYQTFISFICFPQDDSPP